MARWTGNGVWAAAAFAGLAAIAGGALATIGFGHDVGAAVSYHDLVEVVLRWHGRLALWSWIAWVAVAAEAVLLIAWCIVRSFPRGVPRLSVVIAAVVVAAWIAQFGLVWHSHHEQQSPSGEMSMVPGATAISDSTREATLATGPLFPAYGWFGLIVVTALAAVIAVMIVRSRRGGS